jgi:pimeloyl-ACP methyl ester carboxylesterase
MADRLAPGAPYRTIELNGMSAPFYIIPFDKDGVCTGPLTARNLVETVTDQRPTDVFLFSHGWNNDWQAATSRYDEFITGFARMRAEHPLDREFRPALVGVIWPSTALVMPWERGPQILGVDRDDDAVAEERAEIAEVAAIVPEEERARFYELAQRPADLTDQEAAEFAGLVVGAFGGDDELGLVEADAESVLEVWQSLPGRPASDGTLPDLSDIGLPGATPAERPDAAAAGLLQALDPRGLVRLATVLLMKDRAGRVGGRGVADLLEDLLSAGDAHVHLVGHSYGAKVVLSALVAKPHSRQVESVLLLQPAVSNLCFASDADGAGRAGGYRPALERTRQPVMTTYSKHDFPLTKVFHWAVRRPSDLGEAVIAGAPNRYAALGGFGPGGIEGEVSKVLATLPPQNYAMPEPGKRVIAVEASNVIKGHGEVQVPGTFWMLLTQVARSGG